MHIVLILILLAFLIAYIMGLCSLPTGFIFLGGIFIVALIELVWISSMTGKKLVLTNQQAKELEMARKQDKENTVKNNALKAQLQAEHDRKRKQEIAELEASLTQTNMLHAFHRRELNTLDILGPDEQNLDTVNALIKIMESHRADSLPEALRVYDEQAHRRNEAAKAEFDRNMRRIQDNWDRQQQFERDMAEASHRHRMEKLQQEQLDILERERKDNEYYRRYGKMP